MKEMFAKQVAHHVDIHREFSSKSVSFELSLLSIGIFRAPRAN